MNRISLRTLAVCLLAAAAPALLPMTRAAGLPPAGPGVPAWAPDWMQDGSGHTRWDPGRTMALRQAREFDVIIAHSTTYDDYVGAMLNANRNVRLFVYVQGMFSNDRGLPSGWYAHSRSGHRIRSEEFGTFLMNPKSDGWRRKVLSVCRQRLRASRYHGCFLDSLGPTGVNEDSVTALPINPSTHRVYRRRQWLNATKRLSARVEGAIAPRPTLMNGLVDGPGYANESGRTERLLDGATGGMMEAFMRSSRWRTSYYKGVTAWRQDVAALADAARRRQGSIVLAITKVWSSATSAQISSWHRYALASFLLGYKPNHAYFSFRSNHRLTTPYRWWDVRLGAPSGDFHRVRTGMYVRAFGNGLVVVNPTSSAHSMRLRTRYVDLAGVTRRAGSALRLPAHTAQILRKA